VSASTAAATTPPAGAPNAVAAATAPASHAKELALPGMSMSESAITAPPASSAAAVSPPPSPAPAPAAVAVSTKAVQQAAAPAVSTAAVAAAAGMFPMPAQAPVVAQAPAGPTQAQRLLEFDAKIISIQADIAHKESELTHEHDDADRGLLDVESRKTDQVLARLYRAVSEVARREGVSVVIDKTTILYGHQAVDLTDKVLKYLRETPVVPNNP
ncbi:MAG: OmpH family outer membrane protein, partial [Elusimicrobiota bacterium]